MENQPKKEEILKKEIPCITEGCKGLIQAKPQFGTMLYFCGLCKISLDEEEMDEKLKEIRKLKELNSNNPPLDKFMIRR